MRKRLLSLFMALAMILTLVPVSVFAEGQDDNSVTVYFSASHDDQYMVGEATDEVMALKKIEVPYFDLADYGLEEFYFASEDYNSGSQGGGTQESAEGKVTMLHLFIYATEVFYCGVDPDEAGQGYLADQDILGTDVLTISGLSGSAFTENFWGYDMNLNYYLNYEYPLASAGWGATCDQILLEDGDVVTLGHFSSWSFYLDSTAVFNYIKAGDDTVTATATKGEEVELSVYHAGSDGSADYTTAHNPVTCEPEVYYTSVDSLKTGNKGGNVTEWTYAGTADENGKITLDTSDMEAGEYVVSIAGQYGADYTDDICSAPGSIVLKVEEPENTAVYQTSFYGHTAQLNSFKLYTYKNGVKGDTDLLAGAEDSDASNTQVYTTELAAGDYWLEGYDENGDYNGGIVITVEAKDLNEFKVYRAYQIYASNSGWVLNTDYTLSAEVTNQNKTVDRQAEMGSSNSWGNVYPSCLCLEGDTVTITYTPIGDKAADCMETTKSKTMTINDSSWSQKIPETAVLTVVAPEGSVISAGKFHTYYVYNFADVLESGYYHDLTEDTGDDESDTRVYYKFRVAKESVNLSSGPYFFYRVQNEDGVTYWDFFDPTKVSEIIEITEEDLYIGSEEFTSDTVYHNFEKNTYDMADIYMNVNGMGYMDLDVGESYELNVFRNWMAIENFYNRRVALPDMEYEVIDVNGNPSDLLTITPDENNSCVADVTANREGTAIVLVTYDAMYSNCAYVSGSPYQPCEFSAIWPENTGVFVVSVGADGTSIETNMMMERYGSTSKIDAEHDPLFYVGDAGAEYTFTPEEGCTVTVNRSVVGDEMTFSGFTADGVSVDENGAVTVSGLTTGRHIVKVEKDGAATYQVITAKEVSYELQDADGSLLAEDAEIKAGDTVYIQFTGLTNPCEKMSGNYNHNARIYYVGEEDTVFTSVAGGSFGVYDFAGNPERQRISITIPKYWSETSYTLNGAIKMSMSGSAPGAHRATTYEKGVGANYNATVGIGSVLGALPEITIELAETEFLTGTLNFADQDGNAIERADLTITMRDAEGNGVVVAEDGSFKCVAGEYSYIISSSKVQYTTGTISVTEDGENQFAITLQSSSEGAWDGITETEPAMDENGVYQISNGAELAWFAKQSQSSGSTTVSGKLLNDIDLGCYPWSYNSTSEKVTVLDGDGNEIVNLNSTKALFGYLPNGSVVKNLTVRGEITTTGSSGAIAGYVSGSTCLIENCASYVTITGSGSNVGGLVGYAMGATIKNCVNYGKISTTANAAGGIIGSAMNGITVTGCYNTADIVGSTGVGGILGDDNGYGITLDSCYNTGNITGTSYVGGVSGRVKGSISVWSGGPSVVTDCYNVGDVTGTDNVGGLLGSLEVASLTNGYYLEGTAESDPAAESLTETEMKSADLNMDTFGLTCDSYPALKWQSDAAFHVKPENGTVVPPTCTERGYTEYVCPECGVGFISDYTEAVGHDWCEDMEGCDDCVYTAPTCTETGSVVRSCRNENCDELKSEEIPAAGHTEDESKTVAGTLYKDCVCAVCEESYRVWYDERMQYIEMEGDGIAEISMSDSGNYPWIYNEENARFESSNKGVNSSTSSTSVTVTLSSTGTVSFKYGVSSETNYDKMTITAESGGITIAAIANGISGTQESSFETELPAGTYTITFAYSKDSSSASGSDMGWVSDLKLVTETAVDTELEQAKEAAKAELADYKNPEDYREAEQAELAEAIESANAAIDAAATAEEVNAAVEAAKDALDAIKTDAQLKKEEEDEANAKALEEAKEAAKAELADYKNPEDYRETEQAELAEIIESANTAIDAAATAEEVNGAVEAAKKAMDVVKTDNQLTEEEQQKKLPYTDVHESEWYYGYAKDVYEKGLMTGLNETTFGPSVNLARAHFAMILYRMEGSPEVDYKTLYPDVADGEWYTAAVIWASENGIITGYTHNGHFGPADDITREQMATMLYRYAKYKGYDTDTLADLSGYPDHEKVSEFAMDGVRWCVANGIISGDGLTGELMPQGETVRAVCATMISRFTDEF